MSVKINTYLYPTVAEWPALTQRAVTDLTEVNASVAAIMGEVARRGDEALLEYEHRFTGSAITALRVTREEIEEAASAVSAPLKEAIATACDNIRRFHAAQAMTTVEVETTEGVVCRQKAVPIGNVGLYIPGGNAPLFSTVLMLAVPAKLAGCRRIVMCTPAAADGRVNPAILYAARLAGVDEIYKAGGAQAIAAMTYGTAAIARVDKIFGPGNRFVMAAKQRAQASGVAIDMPAGPSEVLIVADEEADATFVAADFLSQSEHGPDSQSILVTASAELAEKTSDAVNSLLRRLPRTDLVESSLSKSRIIVVRDYDEAMAFANAYAPEHLIINSRDSDRLAARVENAGSVFLGQYACESAGDYASGTNHTLPTSGYARAYSGVNLDSFTKKITFQQISADGIRRLGPTIETMAEGEKLYAHKLAVTVRLEQVNKRN